MALSGLFDFFGALGSIQAFAAVVALIAIVLLQPVISVHTSPIQISPGMPWYRQLTSGQHFNIFAHRR